MNEKTFIEKHSYLSFSCYKDLRESIYSLAYKSFIYGKNDVSEKGFEELMENEFKVVKNGFNDC
jgi:hypothetical protein